MPRPHGQLRQSAVLRGSGPGAMVDMPSYAVIIGGLDFWKGEMKQLLFERINAEIAPVRAEYERLIANPREIEDVLRHGAERARAVSRPFLAQIRDRVGIRPLAR